MPHRVCSEDPCHYLHLHISAKPRNYSANWFSSHINKAMSLSLQSVRSCDMNTNIPASELRNTNGKVSLRSIERKKRNTEMV